MKVKRKKESWFYFNVFNFN